MNSNLAYLLLFIVLAVSIPMTLFLANKFVKRYRIMNKKKLLIFILIGIMALTITAMLVAVKPLKKDTWDINEALLKDKIQKQVKSGDRIDLSEFAPFDWDTMYSFTPYTSKEKVYETIGYRWDSISETVSEGMDQIVFTKEGKVVCYIYGYGENNGYGFLISNSSNETTKIIYAKDKSAFSAKKVGKAIYLEYNEIVMQESDPKQVVLDFFKYYEKKDASNMERLITKGKRGISWELNKMDYVKLLKVEEDKTDAMKNGFMGNGLGSVLKPLDVKIFRVTFEIKFNGGSGSGMINGKYDWSYFLIKEKEDSPWLIADWGV